MGSTAYYAGMAEFMLQTRKLGGKGHRSHGSQRGEMRKIPVKAIMLNPTCVKGSSKGEDNRHLQNIKASGAPHVPAVKAASQSPSFQAHVPFIANSAHAPSVFSANCHSAGKPHVATAHEKPIFAPLVALKDVVKPQLRPLQSSFIEGTPANSPIILVAVICPASLSSVQKGPSYSLDYSPIRCFRDDDTIFPEHLIERNSHGEPAMRTKLDIGYSPWAISMMEGFPAMQPAKIKENTGGGTGGGGPRNGDGDGDGGGGGGDDEDAEHAFLLPLLTLGFALLHLLYCVVIYIKDDGFEPEFARTGLGLFGLLAISAIRMSCRTGIEGLILGLGASVGVMVWSAERSYVKREMTPAGFIAVFSAVMSSIFTGALYHSV